MTTPWTADRAPRSWSGSPGGRSTGRTASQTAVHGLTLTWWHLSESTVLRVLAAKGIVLPGNSSAGVKVAFTALDVVPRDVGDAPAVWLTG